MSIREKLKLWLFQDEINTMFNMLTQIRRLEKELDECKQLLTPALDIGMDVGFYEPGHSWAVICIAGKPEYVKFKALDRKTAQELLEWLKSYKESRTMVIDSPFAFRDMVNNFCLK